MAVDLEFNDFIEKLKNWGKTEWVTVYSNNNNDTESCTTYSALISKNHINKSLQDPSWDLSIGDGLPYFSFHFKNGEEIGTYKKYSDGNIEPLVINRHFEGMKSEYWEILEEFRHYFNLYEDKRNNKYILIDDNGDDEDVVLISDKEIKIKLRLIKEFLAIKNMQLAIFFDLYRFSEKTVEDQGLKETQYHKKGDDFIFSRGICNQSFYSKDKMKSSGFLMGKKLISGLKTFTPDLFGKKDKTYADFIIGIDEDGQEITHTSEEKYLANSFGKNPGAPYFLTPSFFRKEVLTKYYSQPEKYSVEDGYLRCGGKWGLRMDNNHTNYVIAFLGDLGYLSYKEQLHWKSFNIATDSKISYTAWERGFEAKFTDPEKSDLYFKQKFIAFQKRWEEKYGWKLFKPLAKKDEHCFRSLHTPLTNEQKEFDEQVLSLTKIVIDSLNEKELTKNLPKEKHLKGIQKLERFLISQEFQSDPMISFLKNLQDLRSTGSAHRKGESYERAQKFFHLDDKDLPIAFDEILIESIRFINTLENRLLNKMDLISN